jgi:hypothetical protein
MTITPTTLSRASGLAAIAAGVLFTGIQLGHPHLDVTTITTTELAIRNSLKVLFAALALVGVTGMYLRQVREIGVLGLVGYLLYATCYLLIGGTAYVAAFILPSVAGTDPAYVSDVLAAASNGHAVGDIGRLQTVISLQGFAYIVGGLLFGIALYRARVLARWAAVLLAVSGVVSVTLSLLPDAFYRLLAYPNAAALIALGYSLWRSTRADGGTRTSPVTTAQLSAAGVE